MYVVKKRIQPPTTYQGGKGRLAPLIVDFIKPSHDWKFCDLCCGSGAVSIELLNRGYNPEKIIMVDKGPWGLFWKMIGEGSYWEPTETSNRRSHVNPMMPMPDTLMDRVRLIAEKMKGITGICQDIMEFVYLFEQVTMYVDPPYGGTTAYGHSFDVEEWAKSQCLNDYRKCYVSEGRPIGTNSKMIACSDNRLKGGISGRRKKPNEEWISEIS